MQATTRGERTSAGQAKAGVDMAMSNQEYARAKPQQSHGHVQPQLRKPLRTVVERSPPSTRPPRRAFQPATLINNPLLASLLTSSGQRLKLQLRRPASA